MKIYVSTKDNSRKNWSVVAERRNVCMHRVNIFHSHESLPNVVILTSIESENNELPIGTGLKFWTKYCFLLSYG